MKSLPTGGIIKKTGRGTEAGETREWTRRARLGGYSGLEKGNGTVSENISGGRKDVDSKSTRYSKPDLY